MAKKSPATGPASGAGFTDTRRVQELIDLMVENGLTELELVEDKSRIVLRRGHSGVGAGPALSVMQSPMAQAAVASAAAAAAPAAAEEETLVTIKSPMVGTFYAAPSPTSEPYVSVGATVNEKTVVCIVEAMKVLNQIHAEAAGTITKILVSNGQTVEFGQPLFLVKPS